MDKLIRGIPDEDAGVLQDLAKQSGLTLEAYLRLKLIEIAKQERQREKQVSQGWAPSMLTQAANEMVGHREITPENLSQYFEQHYSLPLSAVEAREWLKKQSWWAGEDQNTEMKQ